MSKVFRYGMCYTETHLHITDRNQDNY